MTTDVLPSDGKDRRILRYFGGGLLAMGPVGRDWPGFRYTPDEWQRFSSFADGASEGAVMIATWIAAAIFIVIAALVMGLVFIPVMSWLYPDPSKTSALVFLSALFGTALVTLGLGVPFALNLGGFVMDKWAPSDGIPLADPDRALAAKIRWQIWRMIGILCGLGIPISLTMVIYDIDLGPVLRWLKPVVYAVNILAMLFTIVKARQKRAA